MPTRAVWWPDDLYDYIRETSEEKTFSKRAVELAKKGKEVE